VSAVLVLALAAQVELIPPAHGLAMFGAVRAVESVLYPQPFAEMRFSVIAAHYEEAYSRPPIFDTRARAFEWDGDPWPINVIGHALMGSELYLRARTCGARAGAALAFTAAGAVVWDYVFEAGGVRPSLFDLVYTPLAGMALGELRYRIWSNGSPLLRALVDPFGSFERAVLWSPC
jgi:hypothetical protein